MSWTTKAQARKVRASFRPTLETLESREVLSATLITGPSSSATPYIVPVAAGVSVTSIMTVGDSVNNKPDGVTPYRAVGIMDGLGAYDNGDGTFTLLMNHELGNTAGVTRAHGNTGGFVSEWIINKSDLSVVSIRDFIGDATSIFLSNNNPSGGVAHTGFEAAGTTAFNRLCSADLAAATAYLWTDTTTGITYGTTARIFQSGEESGFGRQFAFIATDDPNISGNQAHTAYEIPHCGLFSWENNIANPLAQRKTIVMGMDDTTPGQIYVWVGDKQTTGNVVERAGLTRQSANDNLYVIKVSGLTPDGTGATNEDRATPLSGTFTLENEGDVSGLTGTQLEALSDTNGGTQFLRPEDGQWDPNNPSDFYFVTTDRYDQAKDGIGTQVGRSRLYRLRFTDISNPAAGGTIEALLDGTEAGNMFDNMTIDGDGKVFLQEDVGGQAHSGKIWMYDIATDDLVLVAKHDPARFGDVVNGVVTAPTAPFSNDEESSGIIDVSAILGPGKLLLDVQAHYSLGGELVEGGQLLLLDTNVPTATLTGGKLTVQGTINDDTIAVVKSGSKYVVEVNGKELGRFKASDVDTLRIDAGAGSDLVGIAWNVKADAIVTGGLGNDAIFLGGGSSVAIGGKGSDLLVGGIGEALLIAGNTAHDGNEAKLDAILATWAGHGSYTSRVTAIRADLNSTTVFDDGVIDFLLGGLGRDWFHASDNDFVLRWFGETLS